MDENKWLYLFLGAVLLYVGYNEFIVLPYQTANNYFEAYEMSFRNPIFNIFITLGSYVLLCVGCYSAVAYLDALKVMDHNTSLTTTKKGKWIKGPLKDVQDLKGDRMYRPTWWPKRSLLKNKRGAVSMGKLFIAFILIIIGVALTPTIVEQVTYVTGVGGYNLTGSALALMGLLPMFWVIGVLGVAVALIYLSFRDSQ